MAHNLVDDSPSSGVEQATAYRSLLPLLYAGEQYEGWGQGMRAITLALMANMTLPDGLVVEVGCGGGQLLAELQPHFPTRKVIGADLNPLAITHAQNTLSTEIGLIRAALPNLPWQDDQVALLLALDVFDQEGVELGAALAESYRLLRADGALVMRVSAHPSLYGAHDRAFHTGERYTHRQMYDALLHAGFVVQRLTYANTLLSLPVAAMRLAQRWGLLAWQAETYHHDGLHEIAARLLLEEAKWLYHADLPWGLSLCAVARKP